MVGFILSRLFNGIIVLVSVIVLVCAIIYLAPVDPARLTFGQRSDNQTVLQKQKDLGLDQPLSVQMWRYLSDLSPIWFTKDASRFKEFAGLSWQVGNTSFVVKKPNLRDSYQSGRKVSTLLSETIPKTVILALTAFILATFFGILLGVLAALNKDTWWDHGTIFVTTIGISVPSYVAAIFFALLFGFILAPFTGLNMQGSIFELNDIGDEVINLRNLILPAIALGIRPISIIVQLSRSAMLDVLKSPFVKTATAKGLSFAKVISKHALPNAMNPIVTSLSGWLASLLAGAFFIEKVFNYKGLGELTINALVNYDVPVILGCIIFICATFIIVNILNDIIYRLIDPRVE